MQNTLFRDATLPPREQAGPAAGVECARITRPALLPDRSCTDAEFARIVDELTRRGLLAGGLGTAALLGLAACGSDGTPAAAGGTGPWTYTDDLGRRVTARQRPTRVASLEDGLTATLWSAGLHVVASPLEGGNRPFLDGAGVPHTGIRSIGTDATTLAGSIDVEALAAAKPDLVVDQTNDGTLLIASVNPDIAKIAPVAGLNQTGPTVAAVIGDAERLTRALAIPLADAAARERYETSAARLQKILAAKAGLRVMFCFADGTDGLDIMNPRWYAFMATLAGLGMNFITPPAAYDSQGNAAVSWELLPSLPVDLVLYTGTGMPTGNAAWQAMPAIRAGQYDNTGIGWYAYYYSNYATLFDSLAAVIEKARPGIGPDSGR